MAVINDIRACHERGQPVLVGTTSIEANEHLSAELTKAGLPHNVLNAKQHAREAEVIAQAGLPGAITIATNMAGRGTDIVLGGSIQKEVDAIAQDESLSDSDKAARIAALKGRLAGAPRRRAGRRRPAHHRHRTPRVAPRRQPAARPFRPPGRPRLQPLLPVAGRPAAAHLRVRPRRRDHEPLKMPEGEAIEHPWVTRAIENAQRKVEQRNFDIRKQLLEYDDVSNDQRKVIYEQRNELLASADIGHHPRHARRRAERHHQTCTSCRAAWTSSGTSRAWKKPWPRSSRSICRWCNGWTRTRRSTRKGLRKKIMEAADARLPGEGGAGRRRRPAPVRALAVMLQSLDSHWREHLSALDHLRQGIHLRGYAQKKPKQEYKREAFELFSAHADRDQDRGHADHHHGAGPRAGGRAGRTARRAGQRRVPARRLRRGQDFAEAAPQRRCPRSRGRAYPKVGRNDPCPCGSGKKYKHCHGKLS
jgi:preprotein translocase subunit SecA